MESLVWFVSKHECTRIEVLCTWLFWAQDVPTLYWRSQGVEAFDGSGTPSAARCREVP